MDKIIITDIATMAGAIKEAAHGKPVYYTGTEPKQTHRVDPLGLPTNPANIDLSEDL